MNVHTTILCSYIAYALHKKDSDQLNTLSSSWMTNKYIRDQTMDTTDYVIQKYTADNNHKNDADHTEIEGIDTHNFN